MTNFSPWIHQLNRTRPVIQIDKNEQTDVVIVGAGIAGIATAYFVLRHTDMRVVIIESDRLAHGATGHNAGQIVSYFERQLSDLVKEFGMKMAVDAQNSIDSAWNLLDEIYTEAKLSTPFAQFTGYAGCQDLAEILVHLENNRVSKVGNINSEPLMIAENSEVVSQIPRKYKGLYSLVPHENILSLLETNDKSFIATVCARKGCMNSALFSEEVYGYLKNTYNDRLTLYEGSHVREVVLDNGSARLIVNDHVVNTKRVILCTNGFEKFTITNLIGEEIDSSFHHLVNGRVGYMAAYLEDHERSPIAISYLPKTNSEDRMEEALPYFYLTRRTFELEENIAHSLVCVGGPEAKMDDSNNYHREHPYPNEAHEEIDSFLHESYKYAPSGEIGYQYKWHGLMGYTPNGVRCIGPEPENSVLLYNLGCNGIGILPSIYGGKKISQFLNNEVHEKSIFDPRKKSRKDKK